MSATSVIPRRAVQKLAADVEEEGNGNDDLRDEEVCSGELSGEEDANDIPGANPILSSVNGAMR
jgi:hypothetical protein